MRKYKKCNDLPSDASRRFQKERLVALFGILMATALPALLASAGGLRFSPAQDQHRDDRSVWMYRHEDARDEEALPLSQIIALSLAATNSSDTPAESLAAQAIALRSRAIWWIDYCDAQDGSQEKSDHKNLSHLCDSPSHGLPYLSQEELTAMWGAEETAERIKVGERAVETTQGMVLCYEGEVIPALLHHSAPGSTRSVSALAWVSAVNTPEEGGVHWQYYSAQDVRLSVASAFGIELSEKPWEWEIAAKADSDGWVEEVQIGDTVVSGDAFAASLSLSSVSFTLQVKTDGLVVATKGEGGGCGLSRAGAAIYAKEGLSYGEILAHYFPKCTVEYIGGR